MEQVRRAMAAARKAVLVSYLATSILGLIGGQVWRGRPGLIAALVAAAIGAVLCLATMAVNYYGVKYPDYIAPALGGGMLLKLVALAVGLGLSRRFVCIDTVVLGITLTVMIVVTMFAETVALVRSRIAYVDPKAQLAPTLEGEDR